MPVHVFELPSGTVRIDTHVPKSELTSLCQVGQRINPKRPFLFISTVLGRHLPVSPSMMNRSFQQLADAMDVSNAKDILVCGMAETAVGLGAGVYRALSHKADHVRYLSSTRHPMEGMPVMCEFSEQHSHATDHFIQTFQGQPGALKQVDTLVLVDDEATTGNTFLNLFNALYQSELSNVKQVFLVTLTDWSNGTCVQAIRDLGINCDNVTLLAGQWSFDKNPQFDMPELPSERWPAEQPAPILETSTACRYGLDSTMPCIPPQLKLDEADPIRAGERIHVLGCGEYVWHPFLLAEQLEAAGAEVTFSATTRSPVLPIGPIDSKAIFKDNYGMGIYLYAHNIPDVDRLIICSDTAAEHWDQEWIQSIHHAKVIVHGK